MTRGACFWNMVQMNLKTFAAHKTRAGALCLLIALMCLAAGLVGDVFLRGGDVVGIIAVAVVDKDNSLETRMIVSSIIEQGELHGLIELLPMDEDSALEALAQDRLTAVLTFPPGFGASMVAGENMPFSVAYNLQRPLTSELVKVMSDAFANMLRSSQTGIYVTLNYAATRQITPEQHHAIFLGVNMTFLSLVLNRAEIFAQEVLSITGGLAIWQSYFIAAYLALMTLSAFVMTDVIRYNFGRHTLVSLRMCGVSLDDVFLACVVSYFVLLLALNGGLWLSVALFSAVFALPSIGAGIGLAIGALVVSAVMSVFAAMVTFSFESHLFAGVFAAAFAVMSLFLSGGVVPMEYFSAEVRFASLGVFSTWGSRLLTALISGGDVVWPLVACAVFAAIFAAIGCRAIKACGRVR